MIFRPEEMPVARAISKSNRTSLPRGFDPKRALAASVALDIPHPHSPVPLSSSSFMHWIAPSEKDTANESLERRLWAAADDFRANSGLKSQEYSAPVLGLIFLRFADVRFATRRAALEKSSASLARRSLGEGGSRRGSKIDDPNAYHAEGVLYLPPAARFDALLSFPEGGRTVKNAAGRDEHQSLGHAVNDAMRLIEADNPQLAGVLPKTYQIFEAKLLKGLLKKVSEIPATVDYDAFGRIYEYFLGEFARTEGQKGGEFYTPAGIVRLLTEIIEPYHGLILDPACGSGGMFVQSARFISEHHKNPASELSIYGNEKVGETARLCRMNLAIHGLEGDIKEAITYYEDPHRATGRFDFVLANPPFNVNAVDKERLKDSVGFDKNGAPRRYPFGLPRTDNANYLWIQLFYSALREKAAGTSGGRAGFVMANSASDARASEQEIRQKLIESRAVDVMVAVGPNMFYTVTLPCTLWFLDKGRDGSPSRPKHLRDTILFIDARHVYRQIDRAHRDWTPAQIGFLANIVRLYRGEELDFILGGKEAQEKIREVFGGSANPKSAIRNPKYKDVPGLCRAATIKDVEAQGWSLNPGRYVGVAPGESVSDEDFKEQLETLNEELEVLNAEARELEEKIARNVAEILEA